MSRNAVLRILLVEGDPAIALALESHLNARNHRVAAVARTVEDALTLVIRLSPDVVIIDSLMAGIDTLQRIRSRQPTPAVFLLTDAGDVPDASSQAAQVDGCIVFPLSEEQIDATLAPGLKHRFLSAVPSARHTENFCSILIAEADPAIRKLLCAILEAESYDVTEAADEEEARRLVLTMRFDLVIVDQPSASPGRPPLAAQLQSIVPAMSILFLSATTGESDLPPGTLGNVAFLSRPFAVSDLLGTIASLVRSSPTLGQENKAKPDRMNEEERTDGKRLRGTVW